MKYNSDFQVQDLTYSEKFAIIGGDKFMRDLGVAAHNVWNAFVDAYCNNMYASS